MKKQENNFDKIDKLLFKAFENAPDVPDSTKHTIHNAFKLPRKQKKKNYVYSTLQKVAIFIISFTILTTSVVFAKDIINFITNLFTNSTKAIDTAVENGFVQNIDMDFVFDKNIGIRATQITTDNRNLDIAFEYYSNKTDITNIEIKDFIIKDEQNNIIFYNLEKSNKIDMTNCISSTCKRNNEVTIKNNNFYESFLITASKDLPNFKEIIVEIQSFVLEDKVSNSKEEIDGNWSLSIILNDNITDTVCETYSFSYNEYISNASATLSETSLLIDIELNTDFDEFILSDIDSTILKDITGKEYTCIIKKFYTENNIKYINLKFDISKYYENIDKLNLYIKLDIDKFIDVDLHK